MDGEYRDLFAADVRRAPKPTVDADALTRALRLAGAVMVVASASTFMLQHWDSSGNDLWRYAMLVGQSLLLALAAYFVGLTVREGKSARTFLALVLATMPVSFAVLGGLVYSQFHLEPLSTLPQYASWVAPTRWSAIVAVLGTLAVLVPPAVIAFVALARKQAKALTLTFFASNLLLLIPVREPAAITGVLALSTLGLVWLELGRLGLPAQLDTTEARLARIMPFVAPFLMAGRVFHLYRPTPLFVGGLLLIAAGALWLATSRREFAGLRSLGSWPCALMAVLGWTLCWLDFSGHLHSAFASLVTLGLPSALLLLAASTRAVTSRKALAGLGLGLALVTAVLGPVAELGTLSVLTCLGIGIAAAVWGAALRNVVQTVTGAIVAVIGLGAQVMLAVRAEDLLRWGSLTAVGVLLILGASYVERNKARLARWWDARPGLPMAE